MTSTVIRCCTRTVHNTSVCCVLYVCEYSSSVSSLFSLCVMLCSTEFVHTERTHLKKLKVMLYVS